jgi:NAD(P)-dependent dehydrogenase (short-subunit alcohol dehydrogenase family)
MAGQDEERRIAVVTGASRGAGRGIARALGAAGYVVVVTGRSTDPDAHDLGGTVAATAAEVSAAGGEGVPVVCDHGDDAQVADLFAGVHERFGRLDVLVNNVFAVPDDLLGPEPFWEKSLDLLRMVDIGLRSTYVASWHAAPLLVRGRDALLVNTSGFGGGCYLHGPAYGAVKAGVDKLAHDMAVDFAPYGITAVSIWMGLLRTERTERTLAAHPDSYAESRPLMESPDFTGRLVAALDARPDKFERTGRVLIGAELGVELGVRDVDGSTPQSRRSFLGDPPTFSQAVVR